MAQVKIKHKKPLMIFLKKMGLALMLFVALYFYGAIKWHGFSLIVPCLLALGVLASMVNLIKDIRKEKLK